MPGERKKPTLAKWEKLCEKHRGNITQISKEIGASRPTLRKWMAEDPAFAEAREDGRCALLDECVQTARVVALGIPAKDELGRFAGWVAPPDTSMLRYFMSTLGRGDGFGENIDVTTKGKELGARDLTAAEAAQLFKKLKEEL